MFVALLGRALRLGDVVGARVVLAEVKTPERQDEGRALIASGAVTKGMIPKLEESFAALAEGVRRIHILGRLRPGDLEREVASPGSVGTVLVP